MRGVSSKFKFQVARGVKQGSPALFLLVMDPLLKQLQTSDLGLTANRFYAGGFLHTYLLVEQAIS